MYVISFAKIYKLLKKTEHQIYVDTFCSYADKKHAVDAKELRTIYKQFKKETPSGVIAKAELKEFMKQMNISDPFLQDVVFRMYVVFLFSHHQ